MPIPTGRPITNETKKAVVSCYLSKIMTIGQCAKEMNLSNPTIIKILDEFGIERHKKNRIYSPNLDENYFSCIDTERKAYYLGFLISDGNVFHPESGEDMISISQLESGISILQSFMSDVGCSRSVVNDGRGTFTASVKSTAMANDLSKYGIVPRKTLCSYLPRNFSRDLDRHMIRGILDGDGCIMAKQRPSGKYAHSISFCGTHRLMSDIADCVYEHIGVKRPNVYDYADRHLSEIKYQSIHDCYELGEWLYRDSTIYLPRKRERYNSFVEHYNL